MFRKMLLIAMLGLAPLAPLPAAADGVLSLTLTPRNQDEADLMRLGLGLYALRQQIRDDGTIRQSGAANVAALLQSGSGNWGLIQQRGSGHDATLAQAGGGNAHAIFQTGKNATAVVGQTGNQVGITIQHGF